LPACASLSSFKEAEAFALLEQAMHFAAFGDRSPDRVRAGHALQIRSQEKQESDVFRSHESVLELLRRDCSPDEQQVIHARSASLLSEMFDVPVVKDLIHNIRALSSTAATPCSASALSSSSTMKLRQVLSHAACLRADLMLKSGRVSKSSVAAAQLFQSVHDMLLDAALLNPSNEDCHVQLCSVQFESGNVHLAIEEAQRALLLFPASPTANAILFKSMFVLGRWSVCESIWESYFRHSPVDAVPFEVQAMLRLMRCRNSSHYKAFPLQAQLHDRLVGVVRHCDLLLHPTVSHRCIAPNTLRVFFPSVASLSSSQLTASLFSHWCSDDCLYAHAFLDLVSATVAAKSESKQLESSVVTLTRWLGPAGSTRRTGPPLFILKHDVVYSKSPASTVGTEIEETGDTCSRAAKINKSSGSYSSSFRLSARRLSLNRPNPSQYDLLDDQARLNLGAGDFSPVCRGRSDDSAKDSKDDVGLPKEVIALNPSSSSDSSRRKSNSDGRSGPSTSKLSERDIALMINVFRECGYSIDDCPRAVATKQRLPLQDVLCKWIQTIALQSAGLFYDHARLDVSSFTRDSLCLAPWVRSAFADFSTANLSDAASAAAVDDGRFICAAVVALISSEAVMLSSDSIETDVQYRTSLRLLRSAARALTSAIATNWHLILQKSQESHVFLRDYMLDLQQLLAVVLHCIDFVPDSPLLQRCRENNYSMFRCMIKRATCDILYLDPSEHRVSRTELLLDLPFECRLVAELVATTCMLISESINLKLAQQDVITAENADVVCSDMCGRAARVACSMISRARSSVNFFFRGAVGLSDSADVLSGSVAQQILMSHGPSSSPLTDALHIVQELPLVWETISSILRCSNADISALKTQYQEKGAEKYSNAFYKTVSQFPIPWKIWSTECQKQTSLRPADSAYWSPFLERLSTDRSAVPENCSFFAIESWCAAFHAMCVAIISDVSLSTPPPASAPAHKLAIARLPFLMSLSVSILQLQLLVRSFPYEVADENLAQFPAAFPSSPCPEAIASYAQMWNGEKSGRAMLCASLLATLLRVDEMLERYAALVDGRLPVLSSYVEFFSARCIGKCDANLAAAAAAGEFDKGIAAEKAMVWADAGLKAIDFQSLRMLVLVANNCIVSCPSLNKLVTFLPTGSLSTGGEQAIASTIVCSAAASCITLLRLQKLVNISSGVSLRDIVDSIFYCVDQLCECACVSTYASCILFLRCFNHCGAVRAAWRSSIISSPKRGLSAASVSSTQSSSTFERGTRARVSARDSDIQLQEIHELQGHVDHLQLQCLVGIVGVSHQAPGRKSSTARISAPPASLIGFLPLPLRCEVLREFVSRVEEEDCRGVGALLDRDSMSILLQSLQVPSISVNSAKYEDALLLHMLPEVVGGVSLLASLDLQVMSRLIPEYFKVDLGPAGFTFRLCPLPILCSLIDNVSFLTPSSGGVSADMVIQNICAMKASSVDAASTVRQRGKSTTDSTGEFSSTHTGSGYIELRSQVRELISCALVSPRPLRIWRTIADVLSAQLDAHLAAGEVAHDYPAQACIIGLLMSQLVLLHLDASRNNGFSSQAQTAISIARCLYFLSPVKVWTQDVLTFERCFKPWSSSASTDAAHCCRRWLAALSLSWLRVAKSCSCNQSGVSGGDLPSSILSTIPSDWSLPANWVNSSSDQCSWASAIATECLGVADDINFPVPLARVVLFYAARMARKLSSPSATVLKLLLAAQDIADPKDILGPCDIDLPSTWLLLYQFKYLSSLAFSRAEGNSSTHAEVSDIFTVGTQLSNELDKCKRIGALPLILDTSFILFLSSDFREADSHLRPHQTMHCVSRALLPFSC
jgi:hypothetical protein